MAQNDKTSSENRQSGKARVTLGDLFDVLGKSENKETESEKGNHVDHININDFSEGDHVESTYFCSQKNAALSKAGKTFLNLVIADRSGEMQVRVFDDAERISQNFSTGDFIYLQGRVQSYQGNAQMIATHIERVSPDDLDPEDFMPTSRLGFKKMETSLRNLVDTIEDEQLKALCLAALNDPVIGPKYFKAPAARSMHHSYMHGLLEHTLSMAKLADLVCTHYKNLDRSMLLTGIVFHDIGKIFELNFDMAIDYSDSGKLLGHINMGMMLVEQMAEKVPGFTVEKKRLLEHIILSHHGTREYGSPVIPATVEANIIHHLDNLDAKVNAILGFAEKSPDTSDWTDRHYLLGTQIRKTVSAEGPLYDFNIEPLPEKEKPE